jgi:hypothetical protein
LQLTDISYHIIISYQELFKYEIVLHCTDRKASSKVISTVISLHFTETLTDAAIPFSIFQWKLNNYGSSQVFSVMIFNLVLFYYPEQIYVLLLVLISVDKTQGGVAAVLNYAKIMKAYGSL